ncbi:MAG TPA: hydrogenase [Thermoanaerobaculia bacterium]|jgi:hydroxylaminobenzene mutase|nr:hydrogenase [Thermoanaerobaculia bacterium]
MRPDRRLLRAGFLLVLLALLTGFAIPAFHNQKMAVNAHVTGALNGLLLIALGCAWETLRQGPGRARLTRVLALYGAYTNWGATCLGAAWGTSRLTPQGGAGFTAQPWQEAVVQTLQVSLALAIATAMLLVVLALRPAHEPAAAMEHAQA